MQAEPAFEPKLLSESCDGAGATDRTGGPIECTERVASVELTSAEPFDIAPALRVERGSTRRVGIGGPVNRKHSSQNAVEIRIVPQTCYELLDFANHTGLVADEGEMIASGELNEAGIGNAGGDVAAFVHQQTGIACAMKHEGGHANAGKHVANVDLRIHYRHGERGSGACRHPKISGPPCAKNRVVRDAGSSLFQAKRASPFTLDLR